MALKRQTDKLLTCQPTAYPSQIDIKKGYKIIFYCNYMLRQLFWHWPSKCKEYKQLLLDLLRYFVFCLTLSQTPFKHQVRFQSSRIQNCSSFCTFVPFLRMVEKWNMWLWGPQKGARKIIHFIRRWYNRGLPKLLLRKMLVSKDKV